MEGAMQSITQCGVLGPFFNSGTGIYIVYPLYFSYYGCIRCVSHLRGPTGARSGGLDVFLELLKRRVRD